MKTITIDVSDAVYAEFRRAAQEMGRPTPELIREAIEDYRRARLQPRGELRNFEPLSLGSIASPLTADDNLLDEMLADRRISA